MADNEGGRDAAAQATDTGAKQSESGATPAKTYTDADMQREADRRVNEAQKKWKETMEAAIADKTRDAESKLRDLGAKALEAEQYASFIESVSGQGVKNIKSAYIVAKYGGYFDGRGRLDMDKFQKENAEFFGSRGTANAGAGAGDQHRTTGMNDYIRRAAGLH